MNEFGLSLLETLTAAMGEVQIMTAWELVAVVLALAYLLLAMKANIWCWAAAFFSTAIYTIIFWEVSLLMESALNVYYMAMAGYGYWQWTRGGGEHDGVAISSWSAKRHLVIIVTTAAASVLLGALMANYTQASMPYLDSATTCFAVMTTYLVAKKVLENWLYWVVIDLVSIYLYLSKGLMLTSVLFVIYTLLAISGFVMWRKQMQSHHEVPVLAGI